MKRIIIIGNCGAGKSTLARKIHELTQLPLVHLDREYWQPGWVETDPEIWRNRVEQIAAEDRWIIDGNYGSSMETRLKRADTVILLETPTWKSLLRVLKRIRKYRGESRPDMGEGCVERLDLSFLHYVMIYNFTRRPANHRKIKAFGAHATVHVLKSNREIGQFLEGIENNIRLKNTVT